MSMRSVITKAIVVALLAALLVPTSVSAAPMGPKSDLVAGGGKSFSDILSINAHINPNGKIQGHINAHSVPDYDFPFVVEGNVLCLTIVGNRAAIGGELTTLEAAGWDPNLYHGWYFFVEDNGNQQGVPDKISYQYPTLNPVTTCPNPLPGTAFFEMLEGNIVVSKGN
jgi:hypothetical protein